MFVSHLCLAVRMKIALNYVRYCRYYFPLIWVIFFLRDIKDNKFIPFHNSADYFLRNDDFLAFERIMKCDDSYICLKNYQTPFRPSSEVCYICLEPLKLLAGSSSSSWPRGRYPVIREVYIYCGGTQSRLLFSIGQFIKTYALIFFMISAAFSSTPFSSRSW